MWIKNANGVLSNLDQFGSITVHKIQEDVFQVVAYYSRQNGFEILKQTKTEEEALKFFNNLDKALSINSSV